MDRKKFITSSALLAASALSWGALAKSFTSNSVRVGVIGIHGMGWANLQAILKDKRVQCTALCDVDQDVLTKRVGELAARNIHVTTYTDYKELLNDPKVDAVIIGTPDHWHCLQMVDAVKAGKHVYVEKPIGNSIAECEVMVAAAQSRRAIVQVGQWQRSQQHFKDAIDFVHSGKLGKIRQVKAWSYVGWKTPITKKPDGVAPAGVDYNKWLGPAQKRAFNPNRFHFEFRWFWDYAGGLMTDWGVHMLDYALLGMKVSDPVSVMAAGGKFADPNGASETPDTLTAVYEFEDFNIQWEHAIGISGGPYNRDHGVAFIGNNGTLVLNRGGWEVIPESNRMPAVSLQKSVDDGLDKHMVNFVYAIMQQKPEVLHAPIEAGAHIAIFAQLGNIAYRTGQKLYWDKDKRQFTNRRANRLLAARYHNGYTMPKA
ncbi:Gfo/Idh/MocA family oxidoreductase [Sphingobacterium sp. lm-10]|uniref:Gfo/Idh/MocA family protein n=1 Tax=Sphingobacterium sp. lm-10 TaxID=2944904 RepID=UPI0020229590|nr:Gfo/Idh/MocA family oxidoreductase [Sphingobacterium sp. lm-10]MCL7987537.1 Gfo/Idh/MocA family oxidoreductase [Sphingobacterium sp. lm-10]